MTRGDVRKVSRLPSVLLVLAVWLVSAPSATAAAVLYAGEGSTAPSSLYVLDPADASVVETVGPIGEGITGLAFHPSTGVLYGVSGGRLDPKLMTIDTATGAGTVVGALAETVPDISFRGDGTLFGKTREGDVVTIDLATAAFTTVGPVGVSGTGGGIAFDSQGTLYWATDTAGFLYTIDPTTGAATAGADMDGSGRVATLAFDQADQLFGANPAGELFRIDTVTGHVTVVGTTALDLDGIAFQIPEPAAVPLLAAAAAGVTLGARRRRPSRN